MVDGSKRQPKLQADRAVAADALLTVRVQETAEIRIASDLGRITPAADI